MKKTCKRILGWMMCLAMAAGMLTGLAAGMAKTTQAEQAAAPKAEDSDGIVWNENKGYYEISNYAGLLEFAQIVNGQHSSIPQNTAANAKQMQYSRRIFMLPKRIIRTFRGHR